MAVHYQPKTFLRQTSNRILKEYFERFEGFKDFDWDQITEHEIDGTYACWQGLPEDQRLEVERTFEDVEGIANEEGMKALLDEGTFHELDLGPELGQQKSYRDKALRVAIRHPRVFEVAKTIHRAHTLSTRYWKHRGNMPRVEPNVSPEAVARFGQAISDYFQRAEGRGQQCTVDAYLRLKRYHYFFAYPDNYADTYMGHVQGQFIRRPQRPTFEIVFLYDPVDATLDVYAHGGKDVQRELEILFCRTLLEQELPPESANGHSYELNGLKSRSFLTAARQTDPADGIEEIQVRKLRLSVLGQTKRRITLEADAKSGPEAIYDLKDKCLNRETVSDALINVIQAQFHFRFVQNGGGRQRTLTFEVSYPNSSNLKSCRNEELRQIGDKYLRLWGIDQA